MVIFLVLLTVVVDQCATHAEVRDNRRMFFLVSRLTSRWLAIFLPRTEYSHKTKLLVSRRLKSPVFRRPSPILPPLPNFRPALSFFFLAVRTLLKRSSMLEGNWRAGRWNDRASCFDSRVLYCEQPWVKTITPTTNARDSRRAIEVSAPDMRARQRVGRMFGGLDDVLLP